MSNKTQTFLIVASTLVLGILIGALASGSLRDKRKADLRRLGPEHRFHRVMERIVQPTDEQRALFEATITRHYRRMETIREKHQNEVVAAFDSMQAELMTILTPEQRERLTKELARGPRRLMSQRVEHLAEELQLSEEQKEKLDKVFEQNFGEELTHRWGESPGHGPPPHLRGRMREIEDSIEKILTPEQLEKYRRMRLHHRPGFRGPMHRGMEERRGGPGPGEF